jgi:hypothetical protein
MKSFVRRDHDRRDLIIDLPSQIQHSSGQSSSSRIKRHAIHRAPFSDLCRLHEPSSGSSIRLQQIEHAIQPVADVAQFVAQRFQVFVSRMKSLVCIAAIATEGLSDFG